MAYNARNRLRSMGGIMASSPELMQAAGYQQGGTVAPVVPPVVGAPQSPGMPPEGLNFAEWMELSRREREDLGYPVSIVGGQMHFPDHTTRVLPSGVVDTPRQRESQEFRQRFYDAVGDPLDPFLNPDRALSDVVGFSQRAAGVPLDALGGLASIAGLDSAAAGLEKASDYYYNVGRANIRDGLSTSLGMDSETLSLEPEEFGPALEQVRRDKELGKDTRTNAQLELQRVMPGGMRVGEEDPKILADTKMEESREARAAAQRQLQETAPEELLTIGGKLATLEQLAPPPEDNDNTPSAKRTLRERYEQRLELFKDIFGESDEARARDRAMSLAMLGLAIASGQSPNALTNIAQGAMAGVQGMSEQEQARREREEGIKTMALQTAIDEMSAADRAEAEAAESQLEFERDVDLKLLEQGAGGGASRFNKDDTPADVYREVFQTLSSVMSVEEARQRALEQANNHLVLVRPRLTEEQFAAELRGLQALSGAQAPAPTPDQRIKELREQGVSDEQIKQGFQAAFPELDPSDYGL